VTEIRSERERLDATVAERARRIRRMIESDLDRPRWVRAVRGAGYRFEP